MKKPSGIIRLVSGLLALVLCLSMMAGIIIADIRLATTKENAAKIIRETLFAVHVARPAGVTSGQSGHAAVSRPQARLHPVKLASETPGVITEVLVDWLYENLTDQYGEGITVTQEEIQEFVDASTLKDDISNLAASLINDFVTGNNTTVLDETTLTSLINENAELIESTFHVEVSEEYVSALVSTITSTNYVSQLQQDGIGGLLLDTATGGSTGSDEPDSTAEPDPTGESVPEESAPSSDADTSTEPDTANPVTDLLASFRKATSVGAIIACFGTAAVCAIAIILLNLKYIWYALRKIGVSLLIASLPSAVPTLLALFGVFGTSGVVGAVIAMILKITAPVSVSVFAAGIVLTVVSVILRAGTKKSAALAETTEEISATLIEEEPQQILPEEAEPEE